MKTCNSLLFLFFISILTVVAQTNNWAYELNPVQPSVAGNILLNDNTIDVIKSEKLIELSYFGEPINELLFEINTPSDPDAFISTTHKTEINGLKIYISTVITPSDHHVFLNINTMNGQQLGNSFETATMANILDSGDKTVVFTTQNQEIIIFGKSSIDTYELLNDFSWALTSSFEHLYNDISSVVKDENRFLITTESGKVILLSTSYDVVWQYDTETPIASSSKATDGYIVCGTGRDTTIAFVTKINAAGERLWQQQFTEKSAFKILSVNDIFLIGGINVYSIDSDGNFIWNIELPKSQGIYQMVNDPYKGIILLGKENAFRLKTNSPSSFFSKYNSLDINHVEAHISPTGNLDYNAGALNYPLGAETKTVLANAPLFVGRNKNGDLKGFMNAYNFTGKFNSIPQNGPIKNNQLWKITQKEINNIQSRLNNGDNLEPYSNALLTYPAKGNPHCVIEGEFFNIEEELAPFIDVNNDGIYNLFDGDYPKMKGDQMIWWAKKDTISEFKIHGQWYTYQCGDHMISNTVYVDYEIFNISNDDLTECRFGKFVDWELGQYSDDFIGSMPTANAIYVYNVDAIDGTNDPDCEIDAQTFNDEIPIQSMAFLSDSLASSMYYQGTGDPVAALSPPSSLINIYHFMTARFRDGSELNYGGNGYQNGGDIVQHVFPGNPSRPEEWSMYSVSLSSSNKPMITASPDFELAAGGSRLFSFAFTTHPNVPLPAPDVSGVEATILAISDIYNNGNSFGQLNLGEHLTLEAGQNITLNAGNDGQSYLWSTGETTSTIDITEAGDYAVTLTDQLGCLRTDNINIEQSIPEVKPFPSTDFLLLHPNPVQKGNPAFIQLAEAQFVSEIRLFTVLGQNLSVQKLNSSTSFIQIDAVANLPRGIYLVQLSLMDNKTHVGKLIVE